MTPVRLATLSRWGLGQLPYECRARAGLVLSGSLLSRNSPACLTALREGAWLVARLRGSERQNSWSVHICPEPLTDTTT
jgi:hypothetical protein